MNASAMVFVLLPLAALFGWLIGRRQRQDENGGGLFDFGARQTTEATDKAVEILARYSKQNQNSSVETLLALASLFRTRGEMDKALQIHESLMLRTDLLPKVRNQARFELARDYLRAGMLDRAENIFLDLVEQGYFQPLALQNLVNIYEQQRDWDKAIDVTHHWENTVGETKAHLIAHYYCELAQEKINKKDSDTAQNFLKKSLEVNERCVRASLMLGDLLTQQGDTPAAIRAWRKIVNQRPELVGEAILPLQNAFQSLRDPVGWRDFLQSIPQKHIPPAGYIAMSHLLLWVEGVHSAERYLSDTLASVASWPTLYHLLKLIHDERPDFPYHDTLERLLPSLEKLLNTSNRYECQQCGFNSRTLYWQCPGCRNWDTLLPQEGSLLA